jgi:hypothetical protein
MDQCYATKGIHKSSLELSAQVSKKACKKMNLLLVVDLSTTT